MSKKLLSVAMTLLLALTATTARAEYNYSTEYDARLTVTNSDQGSRYTPTVGIRGSVTGLQTATTNQTSGTNCPLYNDLTETVWEVVAGETLTPSINYVGEWMHKFVYIDFGQDGKFDVCLLGSAPYEMGENNDLVAWNYIDGYNSLGEATANNNTSNPPSFTLPEDMAPGDYRIRFKVDWNDPIPSGTSKDFHLGGLVADVTLRVVPQTLPPTPTTGWDPEKPYYLQVSGSKVYATTSFHEDTNVTMSYILGSTPETFNIIGSDDEGYLIKSIETGNYIGINADRNWNCDNVETRWEIVPVEGKDNTYTINRFGETKGLGWNAGADLPGKGYFTDKQGCEWVIKEKVNVDYIVSYTLTDFDETLGDVFSVTADGEAVSHAAEFKEPKTIVVTATAGESRMVTLMVNKRIVESPFTIEDNTADVTVTAQYEAYRSPTATTEIYHTLDLFGDDMMDLFAKVDAEGRIFPTDAEFEAIGVSLADLAFVRSHVRPQDILDRATRLDMDTYEKRNLWMNIPIGIGKTMGGYPSSNFSDDAFTGWNYTNLFGSWNHGLLHCPGVAADCAHKNGTDIMSGIKFFESWTAGSGAAGWVGKVQETSENGYLAPSGKKYKYVRPLVNALLYFGKDGINYNFEDTGYEKVSEFHSCCYDYAAEIGFTNFHVGLYTAMSTLTTGNVGYLLGKRDESRPGKGQCYDTFLNYAASNFQSSLNIMKSVQAAESAYGMGTTEDVYQGAWIVSMARSWKNLNALEDNKRMGIVLWGEHAQSRLMSYCNGTSSLDFQKNYQLLQDRFFSGGYRNPASRPAETNDSGWDLLKFQGLAHYIPERTAIHQNLPFTTYFSTGNGERYNYKGKKTLGSWYNLGQQDVVPTYRWLVYDKGTTTPTTAGVPYFTHTDAYMGGSALCLDNEAAVDIVLYRAQLTVSEANPVARIALKRVEGAPEGTVSVIVKKQGSGEWLETAFENIEGTEWKEMQKPLEGIAKGDVIEYVGLRTSGNTKDLLVGMLQLDDDIKVEPCKIIAESVLAEVVEECQKSLSVKLRWNVDKSEGYRSNFGMIYNDEAGIDHFEILYKDGPEGRVSEVGRTTSWSAYVGNIATDEATRPFVGVRARSIDGKTFTETTWVEIPRAAVSALPEALSSNGNYPAIILDNSSDGLESAFNNRWVRKFVVENSDADFTYENYAGTPYRQDILAGVEDKNADKTNYIFAEGYTVKVHQGQEAQCSFEFQTTSDPLWFCTCNIYADWDCSEGFDGEGDEVVLILGESNCKHKVEEMTSPYTFTLKVPEDAKPGNSRLRLVFSDAWFPHPGPAGAHNKGFAIDFPMEITGDNPGRDVAADTHDAGVAAEPDGYGNPEEDAIKSVAPEASEVVYDNGELKFKNVDKAWIYTVDGKLVNYVTGGVKSVSAKGLHGAYIIRMQSGQVMRSRKINL